MTLVTIIVFILIFSILVIVHEFGHFAAARRAGVKVEEFGLGLPPRLFGKKKGETLYSINAIPFGGFVKLKGEGGEEIDDPDSLQSKTYGQKALIMAAGVLMNFLLGYVLLMVGMWMGMSTLVSDPKPFITDSAQVDARVVVLQVEVNSPADKAGVKAGDILLSVDGKPLKFVEDLQGELAGKDQATVLVRRDDADIPLQVGTKIENGRQIMGVLADEQVRKAHFTWWKVPYIALLDLWAILVAVAISVGSFFGNLITSGSIDESISGPVGIASITATAVKLGFLSVLQLTIFLSINLGLINLFPFPALDGGRLLFLGAELIAGGRKLQPKVENAIHNVGFLLLLILILFVTYRDIVRLFHG